MKTITPYLAPTLLLLTMAGARPAAATTTFAEQEPNNSLAGAQFLNTTDSKIIVNGDRISSTTADWYKLWFDAGSQIVNLTVTAPGGNVLTPSGTEYQNDPMVGFFNAAGTELAFNDDLGGTAGWNAGLSNINITTSGYYYIAVSGFFDRSFNGTGPFSARANGWTYQVALSRTSVPEPSEWATIALVAMGIGGLMLKARARKAISLSSF
jgi:hypothetical protein